MCVWFCVIPLFCNILNCFLWKQTKNPVSLSCCHKMSWEGVSHSKMLWVLGSQISWVVVLERRVLKAHHFTMQQMQYLLFLKKFFFIFGQSPKQETGDWFSDLLKYPRVTEVKVPYCWGVACFIPVSTVELKKGSACLVGRATLCLHRY